MSEFRTRASSSVELTWNLLHATIDDLEVEVNAGGTADSARISHASDDLTLRDVVADLDGGVVHVSIERFDTISMIDNDVIPVSAAP